MCGISGIMLRPGHRLDLDNHIQSMLIRQSHRGPDNSQALVRKDLGITLGHNRLAILDLSSNGNQPMTSWDGRLVIVFNGEIYNYLELRCDLEKQGIKFRTQTDTEVLLELYRKEGEGCLEKLRGMFAFGVFDFHTGKLFCARDRIGKKPFVYAECPWGLAFASEIPALAQLPELDTSFDQSALASMLVGNLRHIPEPATVYQGIRRLRPGHFLEAKEGRIFRIERFWRPNMSRPHVNSDSIRAELETSVSVRMRSDVPVGALLSGGVDSSSVVALMTRTAKQPVRTYALGRDSSDEDLARARRMAGRLGCIHREFYWDPGRQFDLFCRLLRLWGEPIMLLPLVHSLELCQAVRQDGVKVVMTGIGGDEVFYGYDGHRRQALATRFQGALRRLSPIIRMFPGLSRNGELAALGFPPGSRKARLYQDRAAQTWPKILSPDAGRLVVNLASQELAYWGAACPFPDYIDESGFLGLMVENAHSVAIASDLPAMAAAVEMRAPLLDQELVELGFSANYRQKVPSLTDASRQKLILKKAVADLIPYDLLYARKRGFGFGIQERDVLQGAWKGMFQDVMDGKEDFSGLLDPKAVSVLVSDFQSGRSSDVALLAKIFAMRLWREQRE
jgi:asparagine synthase (glutamine-hydrolysing)